MPAERQRQREGRLASQALRLGMRASAGLMGLAAVLAVLLPGGGTPQRLALLGVGALVATPFLRVLSVLAAFATERQWRMFGVSAAVLALLLAGVWLGAGR